MRFLVLGASGMAGHLISIYLKERGHDVDGLLRRKVDFIECVICDVRDLEKLKHIVQVGNYNAVINAIGSLNQFAELDKENAIFLNAYLPHFLAKITFDSSTQIIHMSTDCVFSGKQGNYTEESFKDGDSFYDRTKALGELVNEKDLTLRNSIIGPDINQNGIGLLNWFLQQNELIKGYKYAMWTGLTTLELAKVIEKATEKKVHGLINMVYENNISKYELLQLCNQVFRGSQINILPDECIKLNKTLLRTNYEFDYEVPDYKTMIFELEQWMREHKQLYPHYYKGK